MSPEQLYDAHMGLTEIAAETQMTMMLLRDPFDLVTWAKMHLTEREMTVGDKLAFGLLYDKQCEMCETDLEMN